MTFVARRCNAETGDHGRHQGRANGEGREEKAGSCAGSGLPFLLRTVREEEKERRQKSPATYAPPTIGRVAGMPQSQLCSGKYFPILSPSSTFKSFFFYPRKLLSPFLWKKLRDGRRNSSGHACIVQLGPTH